MGIGSGSMFGNTMMDFSKAIPSMSGTFMEKVGKKPGSRKKMRLSSDNFSNSSLDVDKSNELK